MTDLQKFSSWLEDKEQKFMEKSLSLKNAVLGLTFVSVLLSIPFLILIIAFIFVNAFFWKSIPILSNKIIHRSIWIAYFLFTLFVIYTIVPSSILNVMYYDVCETMVNTRGAEEVGSEILNECVFGSGNLINTLDLREGFTLIEDLKEEAGRYK